MLTKTNLRMDNAAFLRWAEGREGRYELVRGEVIKMMVGASLGHNIIAQRVEQLLLQQLDSTQWFVLSEGYAVEIGPGRIRYPDVLVDRVGRQFDSLSTDTPALIVEVLSDSTAHIDLGDKAEEYMSLSSVSDYLVLSQQGPKGWRFSRGAGPAPHTLTGRDVMVEIAPLGAKLSFAHIYAGFPDWVEPEHERPRRR